MQLKILSPHKKLSIAVVRRNGLGDLLCSVPLLLYLQKEHRAAITLFVDERNAPLLPYLPPVTRSVIFPKSGNKYLRLLGTALRYRGEFDWAISAKTAPMQLMSAFLYALKAPKRIAYVDARWHRRLINAPVAYHPERAATQHQAVKTLQLVAPHLDAVPEALYPRLILPHPAPPLPLKPPVILLSATTTHLSNRLAPERYAAILNQLYGHQCFSTLIISQPQDQLRAQAIAAYLKMPYRIQLPQHFDQFIQLLSLADLYFVGDGGIAHIGAALGKKELVLYGQTSAIQWRPLNPHAYTLSHPIHVDALPDSAFLQGLIQLITQSHI